MKIIHEVQVTFEDKISEKLNNYLENNFKAQKIPYAINEHYALDVSG